MWFKKDYIRFFEIALRSGNETKYWLIIAKTARYDLSEQAEGLLKEAVEICNIIGSGILTMKGKK